MTTMHSTSETTLNILVFKTDIITADQVEDIGEVLRKEIRIKKWTVDRNDIDNVLRIESFDIGVEEIVLLIKQSGHYCEELED